MVNQSSRNLTAIGPYRLLKLVGFGPISRVYQAQRETGSLEPLALKLIEMTPGTFQQEHRHIFLSQEVNHFKSLVHRSILPLRDAGIYEGYPYLVYPYIKSGSLADYLSSSRASLVPRELALRLISQLGSALALAHQAHLVHGNLKPGNIFLLPAEAEPAGDSVRARSVAALTDFRLDSLTRGVRSARLQSTIAARYMAPEQFWGAITEWSDQYSLACLAYEWLTGRPVFVERDFQGLSKLHALHAPVPPGYFLPDLPRETERALLRALSKRVGDRYPDMQTFLRALLLPSLSDMDEPAFSPGPGIGVFLPTDKLLLPLVADVVGREEAEEKAGAVTQSVPVPPLSRAVLQARKAQLSQDSPWRHLLEETRTVLYHLLVGCSWLLMWCGECWSLFVLLFLVLRNRQELRKSVHESTAHLPIVRPRVATSLWQTTLISSWERGIWRNRRRWKKIVQPALPRPRVARRVTPLVMGLLLGISLSLIGGGVLALYLVEHHPSPSTLRSQAFLVASNAISQPTVTPSMPAIAAFTPIRATPTVRPSPTAQPTRAPQPTPRPPVATCQVHYRVVSQWSGGFEATLTIYNTGSSSIHGWVLQFSFSASQYVTRGWNGHFSQSGARVSITSLSSNSTISAGKKPSSQPDFHGTWRKSNPAPTGFILNGAPCQNI